MIAHTGKFIGGNDMDIAIAFRRFMAEFGKGSERLDGKEIPVGYFLDAIAINDVEAQRRFYVYDNLKTLKQLVGKAKEPEKVSRLIQVYQDRLGYRIVQEAEDTKIALGQTSHSTARVNLTTELLEIPVSVAQMEDAIENPLRSIKTLVQESMIQSGVKPDAVYITGGSARSPILRKALKSVLQDTPIVSGDFDGSVTSGLARWADICFK
ncbi:Hsp70 family protein [Endozoicomonas sp.]|uniref:Hsp70 family protein n=1 Tax=Endozoicomonas sp. TaxID=1892382 RepID=UPI0028865869|nr:Hsp70 family protein [Endozoicomonas sp.]